jgi:hypothetical protein
MALSQHDRESLYRRVERRLAGRLADGDISRDTLRAAIDRVSAAVSSSGTPVQEQNALVVLSAVSTPDLASRARRCLAGVSDAAVAPLDTGAATVGRYTVVVMRVASGVRDRVLEAAGREGWGAWSEPAVAGGVA